MDFISKTIDKYFELVDTVGDFDISGGETFLHPQIGDIIKKALQYEHRFNRLLILTNGTLLPSEDLLQAMKLSDKILVTISNYGVLSKSTSALSRILEQNNIKFRVIDYSDNIFCDGWVNYDSDKQLWHTEDELKRIGQNCAVRNRGCNFLIQNGEIHSCGRSYRRMEIGLIPRNSAEYVDLFDNTVSIEEKRETLLAMFHSDYGTSCAFCYGLCKDSKRYTPAEQLTTEEMNCIKNGAKCYTQVYEMLHCIEKERQHES